MLEEEIIKFLELYTLESEGLLIFI